MALGTKKSNRVRLRRTNFYCSMCGKQGEASGMSMIDYPGGGRICTRCAKDISAGINKKHP